MITASYNLSFSPSLATRIGLNEAIILNQIEYWLSRTKHFYQNSPWIYNSYEQWRRQLPFWSERTIRRAINSLEKAGLVLSKNLNKDKTNKTKWYTINFEQLETLKGSSHPIENTCHLDHIEEDKLTRSNIKDTENTLQKVRERRIFQKIKNFSQKAKNNFRNEQERGARLSEEWNLPKEWKDWAIGTLGWEEGKILREEIKFRNYWVSKDGTGALKLDWRRTWENWCFRDEDFSRKPYPSTTGCTKENSGKVSQETPSLETLEEYISSPPEWKTICERLAKSLGLQTYLGWFKMVKVKVENSTLKLETSSRFTRDWISTHYWEKLIQACDGIFGEDNISWA